jgi:hypothetical protein
MNTNDYYRAVLLGVVVGMASLSLMVLIHPGENVKEPVEPKSNFEVVDNYKGCDVVRYTVPIEAKYHYFLDCNK